MLGQDGTLQSAHNHTDIRWERYVGINRPLALVQKHHGLDFVILAENLRF